jgi:hypothetical protein
MRPRLYIDIDGHIHRGPIMPIEVRDMWLTDRQAEVVDRYLNGEDLDRADEKVFQRAVRRLMMPEAWWRGRGRDPKTGEVRR